MMQHHQCEHMLCGQTWVQQCFRTSRGKYCGHHNFMLKKYKTESIKCSFPKCEIYTKSTTVLCSHHNRNYVRNIKIGLKKQKVIFNKCMSELQKNS